MIGGTGRLDDLECRRRCQGCRCLQGRDEVAVRGGAAIGALQPRGCARVLVPKVVLVARAGACVLVTEVVGILGLAVEIVGPAPTPLVGIAPGHVAACCVAEIRTQGRKRGPLQMIKAPAL